MRRAPLTTLPLALLAACGAEPRDTGAGDSGGSEAPLEPLFSFAVLADPHVTSEGEHADRLAAAVEWINAEADARDIELVVVLGDIGWGGGLELSRDLLDGLSMPYAPVIGDNEVHAGDAAAFSEVFAAPLASLADRSEDWSQANGVTWDAAQGVETAYGNFAFSHRGVRFVSLDWASRSDDPIEGEMGDLHDFEGGSWPWFEAEITSLGEGPGERLVMLSHIPMAMSPGAFDLEEFARVSGLTSAWADQIWANLSGHFHVDVEAEIEDGGYALYVTDAVWDDAITLRVVEVSANEARFAYSLDHVSWSW